MSKYRITDNQSGRTVTVSGERPPSETEAEQIFTDAGLRGGELGGVVGGIGKVAQFLAPETSKLPTAIGQGFQGAVFDKEQFPTERGVVPGLQRSAMQTANMLGTAVRPAVEIASYLVPAGKALKAKAALGATSGAMFGAAQEGATPGDVLTTTATGAALPGALGLLGRGVNKSLGRVGEKATKEGKDLVLRSLKPTKSQLANFQKRAGIDLGDFLKEERITDNFTEQAAARLDDLNTQFDDLATRGGVNVPMTKIREAFAGPIKQLGNSTIPSVKQKAAQLSEVVENIATKYGDEVPLADLTQERRAFDQHLDEGQFSLAPEEANFLRSGRDVLQGLVRETTDTFGAKGELTRLGKKISQYIEFEKIAKKQAQLGRGAGALGLRDFLGAAAGSVIGGPLGLVAGVAANRFAQNPRVLSGASTALEGAGQAMQGAALPQMPGAVTQLLRGAAQSASLPKRAPQNEPKGPMDALRRAQQRQNTQYQRRPGLLP